MRLKSLTVILLYGLLLEPALAQGDTQPIVRIRPSSETVNLGQPVELKVTVLVPSWFTSPPQYPTFELGNAVTRRPPDSSYSIRERVGPDSWSGIVRSYLVYPLLAADYQFSGLSVTVTYADGAVGLDPYLAGTALKLIRTVEGDLGALAAGGAVIIETELQLSGLPAIFLPPLYPAMDIPGVAIYPEEPVVEDGEVSVRRERMTWVFEAGGTVVLPPLEVNWWNTADEVIQETRADAIELRVAGPPLALDEPPPTHSSKGTRAPIWFVGLGIFVLLSMALPRLLRWRQQVRRRFAASEAFAWQQLSTSLAARDARRVYDDLDMWVARMLPPASRQGLMASDPALATELNALGKHLYGSAEPAIDYARLAVRLKRARKHWLALGVNKRRAALPPLNP
jgi:hypothetical protein